MITENLDHIQKSFIDQVQETMDIDTLEKIRVAALGKQGKVSLLMKKLGQCDVSERKILGQQLNTVRQSISDALAHQRQFLEEKAIQERLLKEKIDVTLPARPRTEGYIHPLSQTLYEIYHIFDKMGFERAQGPHIETDFYNFTALNIPADHPARQEHDTFYMNARDEQGHRKVLRTHTSPVQIRTMLGTTPPIKIIAAGRTFRADSDATHTPAFNQVEGLYIDKNIHMGHLKACLFQFIQEFFGKKDLELRFRSSYFPFTEPSAEVDIGCKKTKGQLILGGREDWLEILGCGMIHPNVLKHGGLDPEVYQGFAFGMGIERIAMLKYGIPDLRSFYDSDLRWLQHYGFRSFEALSEGIIQ